MRYEPIEPAHALDLDDPASDYSPAEMARVVIALGLHSDDVTLAESICLRLSRHSEEIVRGNAVLALGHLSRRFGTLTRESRFAVEAALHDPCSDVRGQADAAADDLSHFLGWHILRANPS